MKHLMKKKSIIVGLLFTPCLALFAQASELKASVICAGAATLNNGSIVTIGQQFVGFMSAPDGSASVSAGILPTLLPSQNIGSPVIINPTLTMQNGLFQFGFSTQPGRNYVVQASTNLLDWSPIWTNVGTWTGLQFQDADAWLYPWRFYRIKLD
jgi:hypothetical protein